MNKDLEGINVKNKFEKKWIWVVIIGIIFIIVLIFFIFLCRWRSAIIKQNSMRDSEKRLKTTSIPQQSHTQQTQSIAYSQDSDDEVIKTMITTGDSMYENYNTNNNNNNNNDFETPIGFIDENGVLIVDENGINNNMDDNGIFIINRNETEELFRTGSELADLAKVNAFKNGNINNLPPQPEIYETHTEGGTHTNVKTNGKIGEKSIEPEIIAKWNSNSEHSTSQDNDNHLINNKTPNATSY
eukprot:367440_1